MSDTPDNLVRRTPFPKSISRAVVTPLQPSVAYASPDPDTLDAQYEGREDGFTYSREGHPNATVLAQKIDSLEGATGGLITASGMAAVSATRLTTFWNHGDAGRSDRRECNRSSDHCDNEDDLG